MREAHVFAITSLKDLTSTVAVEAISMGLPIVSLGHCGFADLVTKTCGIKIYPRSAGQIVSEFAAALSTLYRNEPLRRQLAKGAVVRSRDYSWQAKMDILDRIYDTAVAVNRHAKAELTPAKNKLGDKAAAVNSTSAQ